MEQENETAASAFGLDNSKELFNICLDVTLNSKTCSEILNKLICSHLNTKELVYCAFICGKLQEVDVEFAASIFFRKRMEEMFKSKI